MLIPYSTDAPLYHPPIATVGTIIVNVLLFIPVFMHSDPYAMDQYGTESFEDGSMFRQLDTSEMDGEDGEIFNKEDREEIIRRLQAVGAEREARQQQAETTPAKTTIWRLMTLEFGKFRPWQWLTANYMHIDLFHLIGNMFVLWGFGLVVEGKVGWWRFLGIYNLIGIIGWGFVQLLMLFADEGIGLGASLAIFGILVISLVWAPANEMQCVFMLGLRPIVFEASIMTIAMGCVFLQLAISALHIITMTGFGMGMRITSEILHLIGGVLGLGVGIVMVKRNLVDCENWDMFSVWAGKNIRTFEEDRQDVSAELEKIKKQEQKRLAAAESGFGNSSMPTDQSEVLLTQFRSLVAAGRPAEAWAVFCRGERECLGWFVPEPDFVSYISQLRKQQLWENAVGAMQEYLQRYTERETMVRLALAQVLVQQLNKPREAWKVLGEINDALLTPNEKGPYDKLRAACKAKVAAAKNVQPPTGV